MIVCPKCGSPNQLGRVFCAGCGVKLDLSGMTRDAVADMYHVGWLRRHWLKLTLGLVLLLAWYVATFFWPQSALLGEEGRPVGRSRVTTSLGVIGQAKSGAVRSLVVEFTESDINSYFAFGKSKQMGLRDCSVDVEDGYFRVRIVRQLGALKLGAFKWFPQISYDLMCVPVAGIVRPVKVRMGHAAVIGPLKSAIIRKVWALMAAQREWSALTTVSEIRAEKDKLVVVVDNK
jgi:hypothetical protein